ncbi:MAG: hypothetical protein ACI9ZX_002707, partial [Algoriphagus sp.]
MKKLLPLGLILALFVNCAPSEEELMIAGMAKMDTQSWNEAIEY